MTTSSTESNVVQVDFDIYDQALVAPTDVVRERTAEVAALGSVVYSTAHGGHWVVTGYNEIQAVMRDPETFSSWPNNLVPHGAGKFLPLELDPPEHTAYRRALQPLFSPSRMRALEDEIRGIVTELIDGFAETGESNFISDFAHELPARVFLALMDWPLEDAPMFTEATDITLLGKPGATEEESNAARAEAAMRMFTYFGQVVADRRARPEDADDVTTAIVRTPIAVDDGERLLTDEELCNMFFLLLIAGLHTVQGSLAWSLLQLSAHPEQRQRLIDDPSLIQPAVEEILRIEAAVSPGRCATKDTELAGVRIRKGDQLLLILNAANHDVAEFASPDELQLDRSPNRHLSFGSGPHRCLGSHLARVELRIALEELHRRIPDYSIAPGRSPISHVSQVRGVVQLPIVFTPERPTS
ncbi:cytochrome P450 [Pseudonocardia spinosispora]|uniref:cytochrome P450 n=1 Tax=Pseudonocardia spinosispora TaxID=103441 RepID=UPI0004241D52|nr:cytochrome P450 [Pseudonocardia spinosispora]